MTHDTEKNTKGTKHGCIFKAFTVRAESGINEHGPGLDAKHVCGF